MSNQHSLQDKANETAAKSLTIRFVREAMLEVNWQFRVHKGDAENILQRMRMHISRMREKVRKLGKEPRQFKMLHIGTEADPENENYDIVTIVKTQTARQAFSEVLPDQMFAPEKE